MPPSSAPARYTGTRAIPVGDLTAFPGNARTGDIEAIRASVRANGQYRALVVWDSPDALIVLAGNHTLAALRAEGRTTARCEIVECDERTAIRINLADNRTAELGAYDGQALSALLDRLGDDLDGTGYSRGLADTRAQTGPPRRPEPTVELPAAPAARARPCQRCGCDTATGPHTPSAP